MKFTKYLTALAAFAVAAGFTLPANAFSFTSETFTATESDDGGLLGIGKPIAPMGVTLTNLPTPAENTFDLEVEFKDFDLAGQYEFLKIFVNPNNTGWNNTGLNSQPETITDFWFNPRDRNGSFTVENIPFYGFTGGDLGLGFVGSDFGGPFKEVEEGFFVGHLEGSISYQAVPEPFTMLGVGTALGIGGVLKRKYGKKA